MDDKLLAGQCREGKHPPLSRRMLQIVSMYYWQHNAWLGEQRKINKIRHAHDKNYQFHSFSHFLMLSSIKGPSPHPHFHQYVCLYCGFLTRSISYSGYVNIIQTKSHVCCDVYLKATQPIMMMIFLDLTSHWFAFLLLGLWLANILSCASSNFSISPI